MFKFIRFDSYTLIQMKPWKVFENRCLYHNMRTVECGDCDLPIIPQLFNFTRPFDKVTKMEKENTLFSLQLIILTSFLWDKELPQHKANGFRRKVYTTLCNMFIYCRFIPFRLFQKKIIQKQQKNINWMQFILWVWLSRLSTRTKWLKTKKFT